MKIRCDFCDREDAVVFCSADEAALCHACDGRVHEVNEVAQRHHRFSLVSPTYSAADSPVCDICQERRALLFCKEERSILCQECDYPIHTTNEQTRKHCRFLLTGVKLSQVSSELEQSASVSKRRRHIDQAMEGPTVSFEDNSSCSRISDYLETLPGWHVEEFFDRLHDLY